jgi:hypothetical protein
MFSGVPIATERLALCLRTQRRIGSAHALEHLRALTAAMHAISDPLADQLAIDALLELVDAGLEAIALAVAADRLDAPSTARAEAELSAARFRLWELERLHTRLTMASQRVLAVSTIGR